MLSGSNSHTRRPYLFFTILLALGLVLGPFLLASGAVQPILEQERTPVDRWEGIVQSIDSDQAVVIALNDLNESTEGFELHNPRHTARFTAGGVSFTPVAGGPTWGWQLVEVSAVAEQAELQGVQSAGDVSDRVRMDSVQPLQEGSGVISYPRGGLIEQYITRLHSLEQQFIIPAPLGLGGADLLIRGQVRCQGDLERSADGWLWRTAEGAVSLGQVYVFDARGQEIAAELTVTASETLLVVDGDALTRASYPVTIDPEIGANDFRISDMGLRGDANYRAYDPAAAYNSTNNEYLVVWWGDTGIPPLVDSEFEIFAQRVEADTGAEIGTDFRLSDMGPDGDTDYSAWYPAVAYNSTDNEYLVVWWGDDNIAPLVDDEYEIFAQRVSAAGAEIGADIRLSDMGPDGDNNFEVYNPAVVYNSTDNEYLVVWEGDDNTAPLMDGEFEIFAQRVSAAGDEIGVDFRLSDMGPDGNAIFGALDPAVAYNSTDNEYLVVWEGDDDTAPLGDDEYEIFAQRVSAAGVEIGADFRLSDMGPDGDFNFYALDPAVSYNSINNEYLVVWEGGDDTAPLVVGEFEIFAQRVSAAGVEIGADFRLSDMGPDGNTNFNAVNPAVAYNSADNEYLVAWDGDDDTAPLVLSENEIFAQRVDAATGTELGGDTRLSDMGPDGAAIFDGWFSAVTYNDINNEYLVVWHGDDDTPPLVDGQIEIFAQRVDAAKGTEIGADFRLSDMGVSGDADFDASVPAAAYNSVNNEYLVVWQGDTSIAPLVDNEYEIFAQRVDAATGAEIGGDTRLSDMGPDGNADYDASNPAVAYSSKNNQYLVVWQGDTNVAPLIDNEYEIFAQRVDAATGAEIGADTRLSDMGPNGDTLYGIGDPAVAYNSTNDEYLVVWEGDDNFGPLVNDEFEIYAQRVNAATGAEIGANDFRLSDMGWNGTPDFDARNPAVAYNSTDNQYLVVWQGDDDTAPLVNGEFEVFAQRVSATGAEIGSDFRLSDMGPDGDTHYGIGDPAVVHNSTANEYLVVWWGDDNTAPLVDDEYEIFAQRVNAATGAEIGSDFRLSDMGPDGDANFGAYVPSVAYNRANNEYLVTWAGDEDVAPLVHGEWEIFAQRVSAASGVEIGSNDFRISDMGPNGNADFDARNPAVAYNGADNESLVVWQGDDDTPPLVDNQFEIFAQRFGLPLIGLIKNVDINTPQPGQVITYTIAVSNSGSAAATGVVISDTLPMGLAFVGPVTLQGSVGAVANDAGDLPTLASGVAVTPGDTITVTLPVRVDSSVISGTLIANTAAITSSEVSIPITGTVSLTVTAPPPGSGLVLYLPLVMKP